MIVSEYIATYCHCWEAPSAGHAARSWGLLSHAFPLKLASIAARKQLFLFAYCASTTIIITTANLHHHHHIIISDCLLFLLCGFDVVMGLDAYPR